MAKELDKLIWLSLSGYFKPPESFWFLIFYFIYFFNLIDWAIFFFTGTIIFAPWTLYSVSYLHNYMSVTLSPPSSVSDIELIMVLPCFWCSSAAICSLWHEESVVLIAVTEQNCSHFLLFSLKLQKSETSEILSDILVPFMITFLIILVNGMSFEVCPWNLILL